MARRLGRAALALGFIAVALCAISGRWRDPWLWTYIAVWAALVAYAMTIMDDDLARERFKPPSRGADRLWLRAIRVSAIAHLVLAALDIGRWHLSYVPTWLRLISIVGMAISGALVFRAMAANRFFSAVVRIQDDRRHHVIEGGPYAFVRHPGYAGMILAIPLGALVIGSWIGFAAAVIYSALIARRVMFEDAYLQQNLPGYAEYTTRVPHKLVPGIW